MPMPSPSGREMEILKVLWELGQGSVRDEAEQHRGRGRGDEVKAANNGNASCHSFSPFAGGARPYCHAGANAADRSAGQQGLT